MKNQKKTWKLISLISKVSPTHIHYQKLYVLTWRLEDGSLSNKENIPVYRRPFHNIPVASQVDRTNYDLNLNSSDYDLPPLAKDTDEEPEEDSDDDDEAGDTNDFEVSCFGYFTSAFSIHQFGF